MAVFFCRFFVVVQQVLLTDIPEYNNIFVIRFWKGVAWVLFNSYIFILVFFPLCLAGYFSLNHLRKYNLAQFFLLVISFWFYGYFNPAYLKIMFTSICLNYAAAWMMEISSWKTLKKLLLLTALAGNLGLLFYYKYVDFFLANVNQLFGLDFAMRRIVLPLGISFFTFQQISFVVDAYHGEVTVVASGWKACCGRFLQYASFVAYFPQLVAGPIVTHDELLPQFSDVTRKRFNWENFAAGLYIFALGLGKKVLIADLFGEAVNWGYGNLAQIDTTNALLVLVGYYFQVYFDFSGYCDMAIGLARMMNIHLPVNFDSPYKAATITEFWHRWHKTLTRFFTKYIYIPLGGNRRGVLCTCRNIMIVYFVSGLWHGADWSFVVWGVLHGVFCVVNRLLKDTIQRLPRWFNWLCTFAFLNFTWLFFRADNMTAAFEMIRNVVSMEFGPINDALLSVFNITEVVLPVQWVLNLSLTAACPWLMPVLIYSGALLCVLFAPNAYERMERFDASFLSGAVTLVLLVWCIFSLSGVSTFLYFNF